MEKETKLKEQFIKARQSPPTGSQRKWDQELNFQNRTEIDWKFVYSYPFKVTKETKLLNCQFKFIHRRIATNNFLFKIGKSNTEKCTLCNAETESHIHLFWECYYTQSFWNELENWLNRELSQNVNLTKLTCLGLSPIKDNSWKTLSHILLLGRFFIYTCKLERLIPTINAFKIKLRNTQEIERQVATKNSDTQSFQQKWNNIMIPWGPLTHKFPLFQSDNSKVYYVCILQNHLWNVCLPFVSLLFLFFVLSP